MAATGETWQTAARRVREGAKPEAWRCFKPGDRLVIARPIFEMEKERVARVGADHVYEFVEYTRPHGYARCRDGEYGTWLFHPEALEVRP